MALFFLICLLLHRGVTVKSLLGIARTVESYLGTEPCMQSPAGGMCDHDKSRLQWTTETILRCSPTSYFRGAIENIGRSAPTIASNVAMSEVEQNSIPVQDAFLPQFLVPPT